LLRLHLQKITAEPMSGTNIFCKHRQNKGWHYLYNLYFWIRGYSVIYITFYTKDRFFIVIHIYKCLYLHLKLKKQY